MVMNALKFFAKHTVHVPLRIILLSISHIFKQCKSTLLSVKSKCQCIFVSKSLLRSLSTYTLHIHWKRIEHSENVKPMLFLLLMMTGMIIKSGSVHYQRYGRKGRNRQCCLPLNNLHPVQIPKPTTTSLSLINCSALYHHKLCIHSYPIFSLLQSDKEQKILTLTTLLVMMLLQQQQQQRCAVENEMVEKRSRFLI